MADLYSIIPGIVPTQQDLLEAELLAKQVLEAKYPLLDLREGLGLRDLLLRPAATLLATIKLAMEYAQDNVASVTDDTPTEIVDSLLSNWFLDRNLGTKSVINCRLYFARQKNTSISSTVFFSTDNVSKFFPAESLSFAAADMVFDANSNEYYLDVDLSAETEGTQYNIGSGSLLYFSNFDPFFLRAEINYLKTSSIDGETNTEFVNRAKTAISTRNLINVPSIDQNLRAAFNYIDKLVTIGMGDPEMLRDEILAVFTPKPSRPVEFITTAGTLVTVTLANHGFNSGQLIKFTEASPIEYNGEYSINVLDLSRFTYTLPNSALEIYELPKVQAITLPTYIHNGGMVDVYCSHDLATSIIQVELDQFGQSHITGPVYKVNRSEISGGLEEDTCPVYNIRGVSAVSFNGNQVLCTTETPHPFKVGDSVDVTGAAQKQLIISMSASNHIVTVHIPSHGFLKDDTVIITDAIPVSYNGTFKIMDVTQNTFRFYNKDVVLGSASNLGMSAEVDLINGSHTISSVSANVFTFDIGRAVVAPVSGTITSSVLVPFTVIDSYSETKSTQGITSVEKVATVTLPNHGYIDNRYVTISNTGGTAYEGTHLITSIVNGDQFTFNVPMNLPPVSIADSTFVVPWNDFGFSQRQDLLLDMGLANAGTTASFEISYFQNLDSIQSYLESSTNRVLCADLLARGFNFYALDVKLVSYSSPAPDSATVSALIESYLNALPAGGTFVVTDMVTKLRLNGIVDIQNPPEVVYTKYSRDWNTVKTGSIVDVLDPDDRTNVFIIGNVTTSYKAIDNNTLTII